MRDITTLVADEKINIAAVNMTNNSDGTLSISISLETSTLAQLSRLLVKVEGIRGVTSATRIGERPAVAATQTETSSSHPKAASR